MLDDAQANTEFFETLNKLQNNHPDIYNSSKNFFNTDIEKKAIEAN